MFLLDFVVLFLIASALVGAVGAAAYLFGQNRLLRGNAAEDKARNEQLLRDLAAWQDKFLVSSGKGALRPQPTQSSSKPPTPSMRIVAPSAVINEVKRQQGEGIQSAALPPEVPAVPPAIRAPFLQDAGAGSSLN